MAEKKKDQDMEAQHMAMMKLMQTKFKRPLWDRFKDAVGIFFFAIIILFSAILILGIMVFLIVTLIENPVSLAILCLTIFLIWAWGSR